jgi:hypothetical protein
MGNDQDLPLLGSGLKYFVFLGLGSVLVLVRPRCHFISNLNTVQLKSTYNTLVLLFQDFLICFNSIIKENSFEIKKIKLQRET